MRGYGPTTRPFQAEHFLVENRSGNLVRMAVRKDGREEKYRRLGTGLSELDYPEAEATVPIHPETPTSGQPYHCIPLAKGTVQLNSNECNYFVKIQVCDMSLFLRFSEGNGRGNFKFCRAELRHSAWPAFSTTAVSYCSAQSPRRPFVAECCALTADCQAVIRCCSCNSLSGERHGSRRRPGDLPPPG